MLKHWQLYLGESTGNANQSQHVRRNTNYVTNGKYQ